MLGKSCMQNVGQQIVESLEGHERAAKPSGLKADVVLRVSFLEVGIIFPRKHLHCVSNLSSTHAASVDTSTWMLFKITIPMPGR